MSLSDEAREQRIRELIDAIVARASPENRDAIRRVLLNHGQPYVAVGSTDPEIEKLVHELTKLRDESG